VSRGIVNRHSGRIRVHSDDRPSRSYTCFSLFLPQQQPLTLAPASPIPQPGASPIAPLTPPRVEAA
jgi:hypothetical protein